MLCFKKFFYSYSSHKIETYDDYKEYKDMFIYKPFEDIDLYICSIKYMPYKLLVKVYTLYKKVLYNLKILYGYHHTFNCYELVEESL